MRSSSDADRVSRGFVVVVTLFALSGVYAIGSMIVALFQSGIDINLGVANLWVAWRLPQRHRLAWQVARVVTLIGGFAGVAVAWASLMGAEAWFTFMRVRLFPLHPALAVLIALAGVAVASWMWRTLSHPLIRRMYEPSR